MNKEALKSLFRIMKNEKPPWTGPVSVRKLDAMGCVDCDLLFERTKDSRCPHCGGDSTYNVKLFPSARKQQPPSGIEKHYEKANQR